MHWNKKNKPLVEGVKILSFQTPRGPVVDSMMAAARLALRGSVA